MANQQKEFLELYEPVNQKLSNFCYSRTNNVVDAKELISETIARGYENFHKLKNRDAFLSFLIGIAIRIVRNKERQQKLRDLFISSNSQRYESSNENLGLSYDVQVLYNALDKLPTKQKEAVILFEISGFSLKEIQELQEGSLSAIKSRVTRVAHF